MPNYMLRVKITRISFLGNMINKTFRGTLFLTPIIGSSSNSQIKYVHIANSYLTHPGLDRMVAFSSWHFNSLAPGRFECDSKNGIFNLVLLIDIFRSFHDNALRWMPQVLNDDKSTLVQVMAWCRQATSHYLSQCWLSSLSPYGVTRLQWVKMHFLQ